MEDLGNQAEEDEGYDAIVVGSGYGGSVAACRLSMAELSVCLLEKGRKWESQDFPTDSLSVLSAVRVENKNLDIKFGKKDSLFQIHEQDNCVAVVACGLGGGSLVNAGVTIPTPPRAKRDPKWPKEWKKDWEICEAYASEMLRVQRVPHKFSNSKIMEQVLVSGDDFENSFDGPMKLTMNFDIEENGYKSMKSEKMGSCLACGNCLAGCPYNAKNSTDKTYLVSALQAGCTIKTECQVQYIVENPFYNDEILGKKQRVRRWLVFLNEIDYIAADFVILSAGVFGTSEILFRSKSRGLSLSERLGSGFSCNGNNVAYLAGSPIPLNAFGLKAKDLSKIPFKQRPGPSISSSYTSSLGITIQSAILPTAYPYLLFKGITTYRWPNGSWFLHGVIDKLKRVFKLKSSNEMILNTMGYDDSTGEIKFDEKNNEIRFYPPYDSLLPQKVKAFQKISKKLGGTLFMSRYRSTSVHLLGGCNSSSDHSQGVCNPYGQVFDKKTNISVHQGLYVCDASLIPCSIGINPSLTIATLPEHISTHLVNDVLKFKSKQDTIRRDTFSNQNQGFITNSKMGKIPKSNVSFKETMRGYINGMPCEAYLKLEMDSSAWKKLHSKNELSRVYDLVVLRGKVGGYIIFRSLEVDKLHIINGEVDLCKVDERTPYTQYMHYRLHLAASSGSRYILEGKKIMNPYLLALYAWTETTTMQVTLSKIFLNNTKEEMAQMKGTLTISTIEILKTLTSLDGDMKGKFIYLLLRSFYRTYISQVPRGSFNEANTSELSSTTYPTSILHEIHTEDGFMISCIQWECNKYPLKIPGEERKINPVLLINGYATESYCLPTEPNDFVRTLLKEGHETWLLQPRLHHLNSSNNFTIQDIGKFDIPAVMNKIRHLHGELTKVHVVAHCVGGLAIHIALMGGYISAAQIASLSCTNSSMFFDVNFSSKLKMWLPIIPMTMVILGRNTILPLFESLKVSSRQHILKSVARIMPRHQRCNHDECEVFSGIFGNAFWHENVSPSLHNWLNKKNLPSLPMSAFPHLRKICNAGFIVDPRGENAYLAHPERIAVHTLYISGGRTLLVTPHTSFLANNYMRMHQPSFRHERIVVDGFGHSDLWLSEESSERVFPHILKNIRLAEEDKKYMKRGEMNMNAKEALTWGDDLFGEENYGVWNFISPMATLWWFILLLVMVVYYWS